MRLRIKELFTGEDLVRDLAKKKAQAEDTLREIEEILKIYQEDKKWENIMLETSTETRRILLDYRNGHYKSEEFLNAVICIEFQQSRLRPYLNDEWRGILASGRYELLEAAKRAILDRVSKKEELEIIIKRLRRKRSLTIVVRKPRSMQCFG